MSESNENFRDPLGLIWRMLASGKKPARSALFREAMKLAATPADYLFQSQELRRVRETADSDRPQILIVGPPRGGTTLVTQVLSYFLDVSYTSNLGSVFQRCPLIAHQKAGFWKQRRRPNFDSFYGQTEHLSGNNDAFYLWNGWLGEDRYEPAEEISEANAAQMRAYLNAWTAISGQPFLNKNNRNAFAIRLLERHLPAARFVVVRRSPEKIAQSLVIARQRIQGDKAIGWGLNSQSTSQHDDPLAYVDAVCRQVEAIDRRIDHEIAGIPSHKVIECQYEDFCQDPADLIEHVAQEFCVTSLLPQRGPVQSFRPSAGPKIGIEEQKRITKHFLRQRQPAEMVSI